MRRLAARWAWTILTLGTMIASPAIAQNDIEDPTAFAGVWYRIAFDAGGTYLHGDGHGYAGGTWYYYPQTGWWRQWFYNEPYDPDREGQLEYQVYIKAVNPNLPTFAEIRFNWSSPQWSALGAGRPPLPQDVPSVAQEATYMQSKHLYLVDNWFIGTVEPIAAHTIRNYNPEWVSVDVRGRNAYIYRGAFHSCVAKDPALGACYNSATGQCYTCYEQECLAPYTWLGAGSSCADPPPPPAATVPVYRFWSPAHQMHFYTANENERHKLLDRYAGTWADEGIAYFAFLDASEPACCGVHRFWSDSLQAHFYTINEAEKQKLLDGSAGEWTYEGVVFYVYAEGAEPADARAVYRFWSGSLGHHFYTIDEAERDKLIDGHCATWLYEGIAWYAYPP